ncbi:MAG: hypothetical protein ACOYYU_16625 [Chloroflexota bacterium]
MPAIIPQDFVSKIPHRKLDEAVFVACGWPSDLSDEEILERLLALNLERAGDVRIMKIEGKCILDR